MSRSVARFDTTRHYLGSLCKRNHEFKGTGQSIRKRCDRTCIECARAASSGVTKARWAKRVAITNQIKLESGCADCGYREHPAALHFDHMPGTKKFRGVAQMIVNTSMDKLLEEIAKCEVVCANCHAVRTANRRKG